MTEHLSSDAVADDVVRGGIQRALGFVATNLFTAAGAVVLLRYLGVEDFGRYGTVVALLAIVQGVSDAGLTMTATRELSLRADREREDLLAHVVGLRIVLTAAGVVLAVGFAVLAGYDHDMVLGTAVAGAGIFFLSVQSAVLLPLVVDLRNGRLAVNDALRQGVLTACFAALAAAGGSLLSVFAAQLAAGLVLLVATPLFLRPLRVVWPRWGLGPMRDLARVGLPVAVSTVLGVVYLRVLVVLISVVSDSERQIGYYVTSTRIVELFVGLPFLLITVSLPVMSVAARDNEGRVHYVTARTTEILTLGGLLIAIGLVVGADPIVRILGGAQYAPAADVLRIQALVLPLVFANAAWTPTLLGMGRARVLVGASAAGIAVLLVSGLVLIPVLDAQGAALAAIAGDAAVCVVTFTLLRAAGPGRSVSGAGMARILLAVVPSAAVGLSGVGPDLARAVAACVVFIAAALALRAVPPEVTGAASGAVRRLARR